MEICRCGVIRAREIGLVLYLSGLIPLKSNGRNFMLNQFVSVLNWLGE